MHAKTGTLFTCTLNQNPYSHGCGNSITCPKCSIFLMTSNKFQFTGDKDFIHVHVVVDNTFVYM